MLSIPDLVFKNRVVQPLARRISQATISLICGLIDDNDYWYTPEAHTFGVPDTDVDTIREATAAKWVSAMALMALAFAVVLPSTVLIPSGEGVPARIVVIALVLFVLAGAVDALEAELEPLGA